jgi:hypothetical protein
MNDKSGKLPKIDSYKKALEEILYISSDSKEHLTYEDSCKWLELKMKIIRKFAKKGLKYCKKEDKTDIL